jgi:hypothetical protein
MDNGEGEEKEEEEEEEEEEEKRRGCRGVIKLGKKEEE